MKSDTLLLDDYRPDFEGRSFNSSTFAGHLAQEWGETLELPPDVQTERPIFEGITIDPKGAEDLDDGFGIIKTENGYVLTISIADVSEFIKKDSPEYLTALKKKKTYYSGDQQVPDGMLPRDVTENTCSLADGDMRPAISLMLYFDLNMNLRGGKILKTMFLNRKKMSYEDADRILMRRSSPSPYKDMLDTASAIAEKLIRNRSNGKLPWGTLQESETPSNKPVNHTSTKSSQKLSSHIIVQEFMVIYNAFLSKVFSTINVPALFRNCQKPGEPEATVNMTASSLQEDIRRVLKTRQGLGAVYEASASGHDSLGIAEYTHVTSPLRRLADLVNQGILGAILEGDETPYTKPDLEVIAKGLNHGVSCRPMPKPAILSAEILASEALHKKRPLSKIFKKAEDSGISVDELFELMVPFIIDRLNNKYLTLEDLETLLFLKEARKGGEEKIWNIIIDKLSVDPALSSKLFRFCIFETSRIKNVECHYYTLNGEIFALLTAQINGEELSSPTPVSVKNFVEGLDDICSDFLRKYVIGELVPYTETVLNQYPNTIIPDFFAIKNFKEQHSHIISLRVFCIRNKLPLPRYSPCNTDPTHFDPTKQHVNCEIIFNGNIISLVGTGANSFLAKANVSFEMKKLLENAFSSPHSAKKDRASVFAVTV